MPVRIYEIAKKLDIEIRSVLAKAKQLGIAAAKVPSSSLDMVTAEYLTEELERELAASIYRGFCGLGLGNFKAFADTQNVPIRPLTLIFGANSSGKSSVLHGLLLARHALDSGELDVTRTDIGGDSVDLGGFRQFLHRRDTSRRVEWSAELDTGTLRGQSAGRLLDTSKALKLTVSFGVPLDDHGQALPDERPWLIAYELESGGRLVVRLSRRPDGTMHVDRLDRETLQPLIHGVMLSNTTTERIDPTTDMVTLQKAVEELIPAMRFAAQGFLPDRLLGEQSAGSAATQLVPIPKGGRMEQLVGAAKLFIPRAIADLILGVNTALRNQLARVCYLGPLRSFPPRHLAFSDDRGRNWLAGGGYAWDLVRTDIAVRRMVNKWLGSDALSTPYQLAVERLFTSSDAEAALEQGLSSISVALEGKRREAMDAGNEIGDVVAFPFDELGSPEQAKQLLQAIHRRSERNPVDELILVDSRTNTPVTHRDVGIGISQVLPVLVHAYADHGKIVAIEQPEIHLHPALQAELGDVFIESALGERKNTFILETHSEHLILRILRRVRETTEGRVPAGAQPVTPEDLSVVFVEPTPKGSIIRQMPVTPDGDFGVPWPGGFFAERFQDLP